MAVEEQLIDDATARGWPREIERHQATRARLEDLLADLDAPGEQPQGPHDGQSGGDPTAG
jgi:hypothetical protein